MPIDWHQLAAERHTQPPLVDSRRRMRVCFAVFTLLLLAVFARGVQLEWAHGAAFREEANRPLRRERMLPAARGRILARDGTVLAIEQRRPALLVHYRRLKREPTDAGLRLAALCGIEPDSWRRRVAKIVQRVERIKQSVSRRQGRPITVAEELDHHLLAEDLPSAVVRALESDQRRPPAARNYDGMRVEHRSRRYYPAGQLAAHVVGYLGPADAEEIRALTGQAQPERIEGGSVRAAPGRGPVDPRDLQLGDPIGRSGVERQAERVLRGRRGRVIEMTDHGGNVLSSQVDVPATTGGDVTLTIDPALQRAAERLLAEADRRRRVEHPEAAPSGGAIVVMDIASGQLLALASAPAFAPEAFVRLDRDAAGRLLVDPSRPLLNRAIQMALPPGSVMKVVTAAALLGSDGKAPSSEAPAPLAVNQTRRGQAAAGDAQRTPPVFHFDPDEPLLCRGYLKRPDALRCEVFIRHGHGHGEVTLGDALCQSCNVYFFHHARRLGFESLRAWVERFGFGRPTGVRLPGESSGKLPRSGPELLAIGQGELTATPLQVARMVAALANGGRLVTPRIILTTDPPTRPEGSGRAEAGSYSAEAAEVEKIADLTPTTLAVIREGMRRVVADPLGTAHGTLHGSRPSVAGKTGTAQAGPGRVSHAWFAGYAPADRPRVAIVVALEHAGDAATSAGPVVRRLVDSLP